MHLVEICLKGIGERNVESVLPDGNFAVLLDSVIVPRPVGCEDEIPRSKFELVAVHDGEGSGALHHKTQGRSRVPMCCGGLSRTHHLNATEKPAASRAHFLAFGVPQIDHTAPCLFRRDQFQRFQDILPQFLEVPQHRFRGRNRLPRLDLVGNGPERPGVNALQIPIILLKFRIILDNGAA